MEFPNPLSEFVFTRTYARWLEEEGRRETWAEAVGRYMSYMEQNLGDKLTREEYREIGNAIRDMRVLPSMRLFWSAGEMADYTNMASYNCAFVAPTQIGDFAEILFVLMCGTGCGFSVEKKTVDQLPEVAWQDGTVDQHVVGDSREGWADALDIGLNAWFSGSDMEFDYSNVRPAGSRLKKMGGRASGPGPLKDLLEFSRAKVLDQQGAKLRPIDVHDIICKIGDTIVAGGVRRSALISLSDLADTDMRDAKVGRFWVDEPQRALANNSAVYEGKPTEEEFMSEWKALQAAGTGERGIFNRGGLPRQFPERRKVGEHVWGGNPCFAAGTLVHTKTGHFPIEDLVGKTVEVWDGHTWVSVDNFRVTAEDQEVLKITLHDGSEARATPYHKFILEDGTRLEASELQEGDRLMISDAPETHGTVDAPGAYLKGFLVGDGTHIKDKPLLWLYGPKYVCERRLSESAEEIPVEEVRTNAIEEAAFLDAGVGRKRMTGLSVRKTELLPWATEHKKRLPKEVFSWSESTKCAFIAGAMDADGTAMDTVNGFGYQISSVEKEWLLDFQSLLKTLGVYSKLALMKGACSKDFGDGYGTYDSKDCWRLTISQISAITLASAVRFSRLTDLSTKSTAYKVRPRWNRVVSVVPSGIEEQVYCCTVPQTHAFSLTNRLLVGQCGEIYLRSKQTCNLTEIVARAEDTEDDLTEKAAIASILGTYQSTLTNFPYLSDEWRKNCEEERLLGVSITGLWDSPAARDPKVLQAMREQAIVSNKEYAARFGISPSAAITCIKPSGTASQLVDSSSGMHPRHSPFYIRRIRISATDPLLEVFRRQGANVVPEVGQDEATATTFVLEFPVKAPEGAITKDDLTAIEQLEFWKMVKQNFTEHNPSNTVSIGEDEWGIVAEWLWENWDAIGGLSFLPRTDHVYELAPFQEITEKRYHEMLAKTKPVDFARLNEFEKTDQTEGSRELACVSGACAI